MAATLYDVGRYVKCNVALRFYVNGGSCELYEAIRAAELRSFETCEICGAHGERRTGGWIKTLCDEHWKNNRARA
jgi:hypothetical protein